MARLLVILKNITKGLKSPWFMQKAIFVTRLNADIVESPVYIKLCEVPNILEFCNKLRDQ